MIRAMWTAATGMTAQQINVDTVAHNLANVNTNSFKRSRAEFADLLYQIQRLPGTSASNVGIFPVGIQVDTPLLAQHTLVVFAGLKSRSTVIAAHVWLSPEKFVRQSE